MKASFTENQSGKWIFTLAIIMAVLIIINLVMAPQDENSMLAISVLSITLVVVLFLFFRLKTEVYDDKVVLTFGMGPIRKNIDVNNIASVEVVRNKWYYGWGIRYYGSGWLWNIWGLDAVQLSFKDKKSKFRIGSQEAEKLKEEIERKMAS